MKIIRKKDQSKFESPLCGFLVDILRTEKFNIVKANNIGITGSHYHKKSIEVYYLLSGSITLQIRRKNNKNFITLILKNEDVLLLEPYDIHQIIKASKKNELLVFNIPSWQEEDEFEVK